MLFGPVRGNPYRSIRHICRLPRPTASMDRTFISGFSRTSPPSVPTQAASIQCFFRYPCVVRLYFVRPQVPHSTGKPAVFNRSNRAHRGAFACASTFFNTSGFRRRNSSIAAASHRQRNPGGPAAGVELHPVVIMI